MFKYYTLVVANAIGTAVTKPLQLEANNSTDTSRKAAFITLVLSGLSIIASLLAQLYINSFVVHHSKAYPIWRDQIPLGILLWDDHSWHRLLFNKYSLPNIIMPIVIVVQSISLFFIARSVARVSNFIATKYAIAALTAVLLLIAINADVLTSGDMYAYVAYAHLSAHQAYNPTQNMFVGNLAPLNQLPNHLWFGLEPAPYGPLWLAIAHGTIGVGNDLFQSIIANRIINSIAFLICIYTFILLRVNLTIVSLFALNPAIIFDVIADGHNDIVALAFIFAGFALAKRFTWLGTFVSMLAAFIKLPYVVLSLLVVTVFEKLPIRMLAAGAIILAVGGGSYLIGGHDYFHSLTHHVTGNTTHEPHWHEALHIAIVAGSIISIGAAIIFGRYFSPATYMFPVLFAVVHPWYLLAGLPYSLKTGEKLFGAFLVLFPLVGFEMDIIYNPSFISDLLFSAIVGSALFELWKRYNTRQITTKIGA